jgi:hypothetical protein
MIKPPYSISNLANIIFGLSMLADEGLKVPISDVKQHADAGDLWEYLMGVDSSKNLSFGILSGHEWADFRAWYLEEIRAQCRSMEGRERRKCGIENNGICLLISYTAEIMQAGKDLKLK